ncbi:MAG: Hsp20 family protein, partial [Alphaproteobacteria bacterium]
AEDDLDVTVEDRHLVIRGRRPDDSPGGSDAGVEYLHRGIASRQFQRVFVLADGMEVGAASLHNGLLHIEVARPQSAAQSRRIAIGASAGR